MRAFHTVSEWRRRYPGARALLLESPYGAQLLLKADAPTPVGRWALKGIIE
jgi:hypothetical protein